MTEQTTADRVRAILVEHLGADPARVADDTLLVPDHDDRGRKIATDLQDLGADSLDVVELVMAFEEEFDIEIHDYEAQPLNRGTVKDCIELVERKLAA